MSAVWTRSSLMSDQVNEVGAAARTARAAALDSFLAGLLRPSPAAVALVAVGGLGRRECAPYSDLDLILLHTGVQVSEVRQLAAEIWYPIWDTGQELDHSVRTLPEALAVARDDPRVALSLLDARHIAGDPALSEALGRAGADQWRRTAATVLPELREAAARRHRRQGELAFLLEGDLKESAGGLRDVALIRAAGRAGVADTLRPAVRAAHLRLLDARDALHKSVGRRADRLVAQEGDSVAAALGLAHRDALLRRISSDARTISHALDDTWRAARRWRPDRRHRPKPRRRPIAPDVIEHDGEAVLARTAVTARPDPALSLRVAAAAATAGLPIGRTTCEWLATHSPPLPHPWPAAARAAFLTLLGAGQRLVATWETCDRYGLVTSWLPEWHRLRSAPQHNPIHTFTVDRHLVQTAAEAVAYTAEVERPDLLLLGALLHDVGKGLSGDHAEAGAPVAERIASRIGLPAADVTLISQLVRQHLLLSDVATRRDLSDPVTIASVATAVRDVGTLRLLFGLARADAAATGPAAWSDWKGQLVAELVRRVTAALRRGELPTPPEPDQAMVAGPLPAVRLDGDRVSVAADRPGLLAAVSGCLAVHRLDVVSADAATMAGRAVVELVVQPRFGGRPDSAHLAADLRRVAAGDDSLTRRLRLGEVDRTDRPAPKTIWHREAATDAVVLELQAANVPGLLHRVTAALEQAGAQIRAARVATLGGAVVDAFYLVGSWSDAAERDRVEAAVLAAAG